MSEKPKFFATPAAFRAWLEKNHDKVAEQWVGFYKRDSGKPSITWPEAVDEALCFGWIDGVRKSIDDVSYMNRFTPRKAGSNWSLVNINRVKELIAQKRMTPAGLAAFEQHDEAKAKRYTYERGACELDPALLKTFRANQKAWAYYEAQPPGYRRMTCWWIMSAKKEETRLRRLTALMELSEKGLRLQAMEGGASKSR
ncbi:MAG TPA: YdeI/OmpD-associated family protein [Thermoanaerobaculia bacterium]|nr:YdeI/OmpD-associated family protein [Thermoanaerobaculia bacterium]